MLFSELVEAVLETNMRPIIDDLLQMKMITPEMGKGPRIDKLNAYVDQNLASLKTEIDALPHERKVGWIRLNELFLSVVR